MATLGFQPTMASALKPLTERGIVSFLTSRASAEVTHPVLCTFLGDQIGTCSEKSGRTV